MSKIRKNIIILFLLAMNLFSLSSFVSADTNGFLVEYYSDQDLTEKIESGSKLKAGSYYIKIIQSGNASLPSYISIDSEGTNNDVSNHVIENTGSGSFRYNRIINYDPLAIGIDPEVILINGQLPINDSNFYYTDTIVPELDLEATLGESEDTYRLISNEALSYIEIEMSPTLYAILYKGHYKVGSTDYYGWHMVSKKGGMKITVIDIFAHSNEYTTFVDGSKITVMKNDEEDDFSIIVDGPVAQQIRAQNIVPLVVKDVAGNELETEFDLSDLLLKEEEGFLIFKDYIVGDDGIYLEYELNNSNGDKIDIDDAKEIKRKIKGSDYFEDVEGFIVPVEEDREFIYIVLFDKIQYTVEVSFNGVNLLEIQKTGKIKTFQGKLYYEYSINNFNLTGITLYEFGELNNIYNIVANNLYFEINKEGSFSYYFNQNNNWYKFLINFENEPLPAPSLKSATFIEEQNSRRVSFEILSTGHDDVFVNKAILNIFNQGSLTPFITKTIESNLVKDTVYSFEIENNLLSKGTNYEYSITLENGYSSSTSPNKIFTVRPGDVTNVSITKLGENRIRITFTKGEGSNETIILNKDREVIYRGSATSYDYQLTSTDTFIYLIGTLTAYGTEFKSFNEVSVNVSGYFEYFRMGEFNNSPNDYPLRLGNHTQSGGSQDWTSNLSNVNLGDELRFSVYYHNGSSIVAKDTKIELSFNYSQSYYNLNSKISADGFNDYNSQANISLKPNQFIKLQGTGKWYSNYNGNNYMIRDIFYTVENNKVIFSLGDVYPSYAPNDGYIIFNAIVTNNP